MVKYKKIILAFLALIILAFLLVSFQKQFCQLRTNILDLMSVPLKILYYPFKELKAILSYRATLRENTTLKRELGLVRQKQLINSECINEHERLNQILSFKKNQPYNCVIAKVIGRDSSNWFFTFIIDKGRNNNIKRGCAVISPLGVVGRIFEAGKSASRVILLNDPSFKVASIVGRSREQGIVSGRLAGNCSMYYLEKDSDVLVGDKIITSGLGETFPRGILIGAVVSLELDPNGINRIAVIKPAVDLSKLEEVLVIPSE